MFNIKYMEIKDINELKSIIHDVMAGYTAKTESGLDIINYKLDAIKADTTKHNGRLSKAESRLETIERNELTHASRCPHQNKINDISKVLDGQKSIKSFITKTISLTGGILAIVVAIYKILEFLIM